MLNEHSSSKPINWKKGLPADVELFIKKYIAENRRDRPEDVTLHLEYVKARELSDQLLEFEIGDPLVNKLNPHFNTDLCSRKQNVLMLVYYIQKQIKWQKVKLSIMVHLSLKKKNFHSFLYCFLSIRKWRCCIWRIFAVFGWQNSTTRMDRTSRRFRFERKRYRSLFHLSPLERNWNHVSCLHFVALHPRSRTTSMSLFLFSYFCF